MKRLARAAEQRGELTQRIHCASDPDSLDAVSYTHLDVYKRQIQNRLRLYRDILSLCRDHCSIVRQLRGHIAAGVLPVQVYGCLLYTSYRRR